MNIYPVYNFPPPITGNSFSNTHVLTHSHSPPLHSWNAWQRTVWSCYCQHHWYKCWLYIQLSFQTLFITYQVSWWLSTEAFTCWYPVCWLPHHFLKGWKCHWCCQNLARHDQHILLYQNCKKSSQDHSNKGCNKAKMAFSLQEAE